MCGILSFNILCLTACENIPTGNITSSGNNMTSSAVSSDTAKGDICGKIIDDIKNYCHLSDMADVSQEQLFSLYGIKDEHVAYFSAIKANDSVCKDEAIVVQAMDEGSACSVRDALQTHYNKILKESKEYLPDEYEKVKQSAVVKDGIYVYLFISDENDKMTEIYHSYDK